LASKIAERLKALSTDIDILKAISRVSGKTLEARGLEN